MFVHLRCVRQNNKMSSELGPELVRRIAIQTRAQFRAMVQLAGLRGARHPFSESRPPTLAAPGSAWGGA